MPCRSTKYPAWACAIHRFMCTTGHLLCVSTLQLLDRAMYAVKINKVSVMDLLVSTFNSWHVYSSVSLVNFTWGML